MAKRIKIRTDPAPIRTHVELDSLQLLGLRGGIPNSILVGLATGHTKGDEFVRDRLFPKGPLEGQELYDKDPEAFDRVIAATLAYLVETGTIDGTTE